MSFFTRPNEDAYTGPMATAAFGPRLDFLGAWDAAYQNQAKNMSMFGLEFALREAEQEQIQRAKAAGVTLKSLNDSEGESFAPGVNSRPYFDAAKQIVEGGSMDVANRLANANADIMTAMEKHPGLDLKTYDELFQGVQAKAKQAEQKWNNSQTTWGGMFGGFFGEAVAGVDPRTDPLNTITLGVGGAGKSVIGRIAEQAGGQAVTEAFNQVTGVQENRRLLGLDYGIGNAASQVIGAAVGGAAIQGTGEVVAAGLKWANRRWFRDVPHDPAPPVPEPRPRAAPREGQVLGAPEQTTFPETPQFERVNVLDDFDTFMEVVGHPKPHGESRIARQRTVLDIENVAKQLDDFAGPAPWEVKPATDTAAPPDVTRLTYDRPYSRVIDNLDTVDDIARRIDPEAFRLYDKLETQGQQVRAWIDELDGQREARATEAVKELDAKIAETERKLEKASAKNKGRLSTELEQLRGAREEQFSAVRGVDSPDQARLRRRLVELDKQQRDLAPVVSRAYSAAKGEWRSQPLDIDALRWLKQREQGSFRFRDDAPGAQPTIEKQVGTTVDLRDVAAKPTVVDKVPALQRRPDIVQSMPADADAADTLAKVVETELKAVGDAVEQFRTTLAALQESPDGKIVLPGGQELSLKDDFVHVPVADGEGTKQVSLKALLKDLSDDELALKAVGSCSTGNPSSPAS